MPSRACPGSVVAAQVTGVFLFFVIRKQEPLLFFLTAWRSLPFLE
jgi:hypothetical protein